MLLEGIYPSTNCTENRHALRTNQPTKTYMSYNKPHNKEGEFIDTTNIRIKVREKFK